MQQLCPSPTIYDPINLLQSQTPIKERNSPNLCLAFLALHVLVCTESRSTTEKNNSVEAEAHSGRSRRGGGGAGNLCDLGFWVSILFAKQVSNLV